MPHERERYLQLRLKQTLKYSPIVGILGQRQVGKTTLLEKVVSEYATLDRERYLLLAESDAEAFLEGHAKPFGIDEAQLSEQLFPALKEHVRIHKAPGQFILTGSVRFTSKKKIRESLTGRIVSLELLPFTIREADELPLPGILHGLAKARTQTDIERLCAETSVTQEHFYSYLLKGGLPGICFFRDESIRTQKFEAHLDTILNRDIRHIYPTTILYPSLRRLLVYLSRNQGNPFRLLEAARESQISTVTLPKILFAFEGLFLIRPMEIRGIQKITYFLEDQGMASWLTGHSLFESRDDITRGLYANIRQEVMYMPERGKEMFHWCTRNGAEVPLVVAFKDTMVGILPTPDSLPSAKIIRSAGSFLKSFPQAKAIIAYSGNSVRQQKPNLFWIPFWCLV